MRSNKIMLCTLAEKRIISLFFPAFNISGCRSIYKALCIVGGLFDWKLLPWQGLFSCNLKKYDRLFPWMICFHGLVYYKATQKISLFSWQIVCEVGEIPQLEIENCLLEINKRGAVVVEPPWQPIRHIFQGIWKRDEWESDALKKK